MSFSSFRNSTALFFSPSKAFFSFSTNFTLFSWESGKKKQHFYITVSLDGREQEKMVEFIEKIPWTFIQMTINIDKLYI